jgi:hypothetical protein
MAMVLPNVDIDELASPSLLLGWLTYVPYSELPAFEPVALPCILMKEVEPEDEFCRNVTSA